MPVHTLDTLDAFVGFTGEIKLLKFCVMQFTGFESVCNILASFHACRPCTFAFFFCLFFLLGGEE